MGAEKELPAPAPVEVTTVEIIKEIRVETTPNLFILYTLKDGVTPEQFEDWVRTTDQPSMRSLARVQSFRTYRAERMLMGEDKPGVAYIEAFAIPDLDGFVAEDMAGETVQTVMGAFMGLAEAPQFIVVSEVQ
ncbi:MAG: REDY-like protein HapK [Hyphomonas sp.]|nr:REDY-like protein HapK [Hyphomonas sp.]MBU3920827.1 REDY-like protein HapK [Alphaproteobacteria bacterium]MBU4060941.1 REDY-like protein HapK [Alphaproteobacteria bacterium]MBU4166149.1 REDY-like protein HapK [Alphaproteobacteria bacterium]